MKFIKYITLTLLLTVCALPLGAETTAEKGERLSSDIMTIASQMQHKISRYIEGKIEGLLLTPEQKTILMNEYNALKAELEASVQELP